MWQEPTLFAQILQILTPVLITAVGILVAFLNRKKAALERDTALLIMENTVLTKQIATMQLAAATRGTYVVELAQKTASNLVDNLATTKEVSDKLDTVVETQRIVKETLDDKETTVNLNIKQMKDK